MANEWLNLEQVEVRTVKSKATGQWLVLSDDIPGLYVHGDSLDEVLEKTPRAIEEMFHALGRENVRIAGVEEVRAGFGNYQETTSRFRLAA